MGSLYAKSASTVCRILFREGLLYYRCELLIYHVSQTTTLKLSCSVICTITLVLTIMIDSTVQSIRDVASQYVRFHHYLVHGRLTNSVLTRSIRLHLW